MGVKRFVIDHWSPITSILRVSTGDFSVLQVDPHDGDRGPVAQEAREPMGVPGGDGGVRGDGDLWEGRVGRGAGLRSPGNRAGAALSVRRRVPAQRAGVYVYMYLVLYCCINAPVNHTLPCTLVLCTRISASYTV